MWPYCHVLIILSLNKFIVIKTILFIGSQTILVSITTANNYYIHVTLHNENVTTVQGFEHYCFILLATCF